MKRKKVKSSSFNLSYFLRVDYLNKILLFLFILFLPTQLGKHFFLPFSYLSGVRVDYLAPTIYLTDIIIFFLFLLNIKTVFNFLTQKKILVPLIIFLIPQLLNYSIAQLPFISIYRYIKIIELLIVIVLVSHIKLSPKLVILSFLAMAILELILSIFQIKFGHSLQGFFYFLGERYFSLSTPGIAKAAISGIEFLRSYGTFSHPNSMAGFYLLLYFYFLTNKKFNRWPILKFFSLATFSFLIVISFSKIAISAFLILNTLYFILNTNCRLCTLAKIIAFGVIGLIFFQAQTDPHTIQKRLELIKNSLTIISHHPIFGVGLGNYLVAQNQFISRYPFFLNQPVHNIFLLFLAETGLVFGGLIIFFLFPSIKRLVKVAPFVFLVILLTGFFDHYWLTLQQNFLLIGVIFGFFLKLKRV